MYKNNIVRISPAATVSNHKSILPIDGHLINLKAKDASVSIRKRDILVLHKGDKDPLQRMLNAIQPGSYIQPHIHRNPLKAESVILLQGSLGFVIFNHNGTPDKANFVLLDRSHKIIGVDYREGVWHTFFALEPDTVIFEVKPGPYDSSTDKEFASWSPHEGSTEAHSYLAKLEDTFRAHFKLVPRSWHL
ncbi:MAG: WbuC family cupin fold metalloprotein [Spirochaetes bacterium]|nr:WbuC family cupin fold metalloprotein [Spirochaetota bacterium]